MRQDESAGQEAPSVACLPNFLPHIGAPMQARLAATSIAHQAAQNASAPPAKRFERTCGAHAALVQVAAQRAHPPAVEVWRV